MNGNDPYDVERFSEAQNRWIEQVQKELQEGRKQSHWMWFIFPQRKGLGHSAMANRYGLSSGKEAEAYRTHPILGSRLRHCTSLVLFVERRSIEQIFEDPGHLKFRSFMTLFANVDSESAIFNNARKKYFAGKPDQLTIQRLKGEK